MVHVSVVWVAVVLLATTAVQGSNAQRQGSQHVRVVPRIQRERGAKQVISVVVHSVEDKKFEVFNGVRSGAAGASFQDTQNSTGWGVLNIKTDSSTGTDKEQLYAAGVAEGTLTAPRVCIS
eukprot:TRINITY_DN549_c0_g1_i11.p1 TRINITY_DN549_c0_g1~~TRINITY_DN549_c0_g1_i11.p1  ORF type:complete len:121 (+),score=25.30 TRINITY_DN549_c0_g1_i11:156-518(+)